MKGILVAASLMLAGSTAAIAEVNSAAWPPSYPPIIHVTDYSECGDINKPIAIPDAFTGSTTYMSVKTDRGWCTYSVPGADNPVWGAQNESPLGDSGSDGDGEGGEAK